MIRALAVCAVLGATAVTGEEDAQVVCQWDFSRGMQGWVPNASAVVRQDRDGIIIESDGRDAQLMSPALDLEPRAGDVLEVQIRPGDEL